MKNYLASGVHRTLVASAVLVGVAGAAMPAFAAASKAPMEKAPMESTAIVGGWTDATTLRLAASSGRLLMDRIHAAKQMIESELYAAAQKELDAAEDTAGAIKTMMPFITVVDDVKDARKNLKIESIDQFRDSLFPIYANLDRMSIYAPATAKDAKDKVKDAEAKAGAGKIDEADKSLQDAEELVTESTVYMPIDYVYDQVSIARAALSGAEPSPIPAMHAIDKALNSLVTVVTTLESTPKA